MHEAYAAWVRCCRPWPTPIRAPCPIIPTSDRVRHKPCSVQTGDRRRPCGLEKPSGLRRTDFRGATGGCPRASGAIVSVSTTTVSALRRAPLTHVPACSRRRGTRLGPPPAGRRCPAGTLAPASGRATEGPRSHGVFTSVPVVAALATSVERKRSTTLYRKKRVTAGSHTMVLRSPPHLHLQPIIIASPSHRHASPPTNTQHLTHLLRHLGPASGRLNQNLSRGTRWARSKRFRRRVA